MKNLLLKDLCGRLPYGVKCNYYDVCEGEYDSGTIIGLDRDHYIHVNGICIYVEEIKLYLYPISSMTEEQIAQLEFWAFMKEYHKITDFYYENHIDFRGLIEKRLAIDCTNLNIFDYV